MLEDRQKFHRPGGALAHICIDGIGERCKMEKTVFSCARAVISRREDPCRRSQPTLGKGDRNMLQGSYVALVTPFKHGGIDYSALEALLEFHLAEGTHGILLLGTTAEPAALASDE